MKNFLSIFLIIILSIVLSACTKNEQQDSLAVIKQRDKLIVGVKFDSKPFGFLENGEVVGFDVELAENIAKNILGSKKKVEFIRVLPETRISSLMKNEVDMVIATMSITENRQFLVDFSYPYFVAGQAIIIRSNDKDIKSVTDLNNKKIGVVLTTTSEIVLRRFAPNAVVKGFTNYDAAFRALKNDSVRAMIADDAILYGFLIDNPQFDILKTRLTKEYYAIAFKKDNSTLSLQNNVNQILSRMNSENELKKLKRKWQIKS